MKTFGIAVLAATGLTFGQTKLDTKTQTKNVDFSQAVSVRPFPTGTVFPGTCKTGEMFFKTDAPAGTNLYGCVAANVWAPMPQSSGSSGSGVPYTGAANDVDLGTHGLKAAFIDLTSGGPYKVDVVQGTGCPSTATTGSDYTLCMESGVMKKVNPSGAKTVLNLPTGTCSSGQHMDAINADLSVHCTADSGGSGGVNGWYLQIGATNYLMPWMFAATPVTSTTGWSAGFGSPAVASVGGSLEITNPPNTSTIYETSLGSSTTLTAVLNCSYVYPNNNIGYNPQCGVTARDSSTGKFFMCALWFDGPGSKVNHISCNQMNADGSWNSPAGYNGLFSLQSSVIFFRMVFSTGNIDVRVSNNGGQTWDTLLSYPTAYWISGLDKVGVYQNSDESTLRVSTDIMSWRLQ